MTRTILIIDDEQEFIDMISMRLEASGYEVAGANDGQEGFEKAQNIDPGLILLDIMMPVMDGFDTLKKLKREDGTKLIPVIMLTARGESSSIFKAQNLGASDFLMKPCETEELFEIVRKYVG
jgi:DNA-binding response OmpR family regulator